MFPKPYAPMGLQQRIDSYADMTKVIARRILQDKKDQDWAFDQLMQAEAEVLGKAHGWEDVKLSGIVPEGRNRYAPLPGHGAPATHVEGEHAHTREKKHAKKREDDEVEPDISDPEPPVDPLPPPGDLEEPTDPEPIG